MLLFALLNLLLLLLTPSLLHLLGEAWSFEASGVAVGLLGSILLLSRHHQHLILLVGDYYVVVVLIYSGRVVTVLQHGASRRSRLEEAVVGVSVSGSPGHLLLLLIVAALAYIYVFVVLTVHASAFTVEEIVLLGRLVPDSLLDFSEVLDRLLIRHGGEFEILLLTDLF